jgi:hypothetical protein
VYLGGKTAQGYGHARIGWVQQPDALNALDTWTTHLLDHRDDILALIRDLTA